MAKRKLTISIDEELWRKAHQKKAETGVSISHVVGKALEKWVKWESFLKRLRVLDEQNDCREE